MIQHNLNTYIYHKRKQHTQKNLLQNIITIIHINIIVTEPLYIFRTIRILAMNYIFAAILVSNHDLINDINLSRMRMVFSIWLPCTCNKSSIKFTICQNTEVLILSKILC